MQLNAALLVASLTLPASALAADVVWLQPAPDGATTAQVMAQAGGGQSLEPATFRAAATNWTADDDQAYTNLDNALQTVRPYENKLDGELVIMEDLSRPIAAITAIRSDTERNKLFAALAYQGFAVDRFYGDKLGEADAAAPFRYDLEGIVVELPWMDAVALEPERQITPYEIAEGPQRADYSEIQAAVRRALPASVIPQKLPAGSQVYVDGRVADASATGTVRLVPGRHLVHVQDAAGRILARHDVRLAPGQRYELTVPITDAGFDVFVDQLSAGNGKPADGIVACVQALGGEVWFARPEGRTTRLWKVTTAGFEEVPLAKLGGGGGGGDDEGGLSVAAGVGGGWLGSGDFYAQDPWRVPHAGSSVNAGALGLAVEVAYDLGILRLGAGVDALYTFGEHHTALSGEGGFRLRPYPHATVGISYAQATVGFVFPYHLGGGLQATIPLAAGLEVRGHLIGGLPLNATRADGSAWKGHPMAGGWIGVGYRLGL